MLRGERVDNDEADRKGGRGLDFEMTYCCCAHQHQEVRIIGEICTPRMGLSKQPLSKPSLN